MHKWWWGGVDVCSVSGQIVFGLHEKGDVAL